MKGIVLLLAAALPVFEAAAQTQDTTRQDTTYRFTDITRLPATSVKDQNRAGTCWSWSTTSFLESEMMRLGKDSTNLSAMYFVKHAYFDKGIKYVRMHGTMNFGVGGASGDAVEVLERYGMVPMEVYEGLEYGEESHVFGEIDAVLKAYMEAVVTNPNEQLTTAWKRGFDAVLEAYLGAEPERFTWRGREYTPRSFADEVMGLNAEDYVGLTSFTHHPYYERFALENPDNWRWEGVYNLPLEELMEVVDNAIAGGYTFVWGADVSEEGFLSRKQGVAVVPLREMAGEMGEEMAGAEIAKWEAMAGETRGAGVVDWRKGPAPERVITPEARQEEFDNYLTTDDHGMHVIGKAVDQRGTEYFIVKNSWNKYNRFGGYFYASRAYVMLKTMDILVHRDAIPAKIRAKLNIK